MLHTGVMIRLGTPADLAAASSVYRRASLSNAGDRDTLLAHPQYLILGAEGLTEGRTHVAEQDGSVIGFATWAEAAGATELEDLFVDPGYRRRGIATALVSRIAEVVRARGAERLEVTANPHALEFYRTVGFTGCGVAATDFGVAHHMVLMFSLERRHPHMPTPRHRQHDDSPLCATCGRSFRNAGLHKHSVQVGRTGP